MAAERSSRRCGDASFNYRAVVVSLKNMADSSITVNQEAQFSIDTSKAGNATLGARIVDSERKEVAHDLKKTESSTYICKFTPTDVGQHMIFICFGGMNIVGSPFKVEVTEETTGLPQGSMTIPDELQDLVRRPLQFEVKGNLGEGQFGKVMEVEVMFDQNELKVYAAKTAKGENQADVLNEAKIMKSFNHTHVMNLKGIVLCSNTIYILMPLMGRGNLRDYLINHKTSIQDVNILIDYAYQVASGMKYISELKLVHRDLAARNCLLSDTNLLKISDFGLTRDNFNAYYKMINKQKRLPLKWLAPEVFNDFTFTTANDVWAYGILVWEIFTYGEEPYGDVKEEDVHSFLNAECRLQAPDNAPTMMSQLMQQCWHSDPSRRPRFDEICSIIEELSRQTGGLLVKYKNI